MNQMRTIRLLALFLALSLLSGCSGPVPLRDEISATLPPVENRYATPAAGSAREYAETVLLYLPGVSSNQLITVPERILIPSDQHPAEATVRKLLSFTGSETARPLFPEALLRLQEGTQALEVSGDIATVNLSANAGLLSKQDLFMLRRAIANTLMQWRDIRYVNVLITGMEPGVDQASLTPAGSMQFTRNEDAPALWDSLSSRSSLEGAEVQRFSSVCTLYFPAGYGTGILSEARTVSFPGQSYRQIASSLLEALSAGPQTLHQNPVMPDLVTLLTQPPTVEEGDDGRYVIDLQFMEIANQTFVNAGVPRSVMLAAITYTLTTFIPRLEGVRIRIGNEQIEGIVPGGIYEGAGEQILFAGSVLRRSDFSVFLLTDCTLYFASGESLVPVRRPIPHGSAFNRKYLVEQLMLGPQAFDSVIGTEPVFPQGISTEHLIAVDKEGDTAQVNFSGSFLELSRDLSPQKEKLLIYSLVNTLCDTRLIKRVRLYVDGVQPESLAGEVWLPGEFLKNPEMVR